MVVDQHAVPEYKWMEYVCLNVYKAIVSVNYKSELGFSINFVYAVFYTFRQVEFECLTAPLTIISMYKRMV